MDTSSETSVQFISKSKDIYYKGIEAGIVCATASSVIGTSSGFILAWGPVFWGLMFAFFGFMIGFGAYLLIKKFIHYWHHPKKLPEITVIVQCSKEQSTSIIKNMWKYGVLTVGKTYNTK